MRAPLPNLGSCKNTGTWSDKEVKFCKECLDSNNNKEKFFCGDRCINKYSSSLCSLKELVAKNKDQCENPCFQEGTPTIGGGCSDKFDCDIGESCEIKVVPVYDGDELRGSEKRGVCTDKILNTPINNEYLLNTMFIGVF